MNEFLVNIVEYLVNKLKSQQPFGGYHQTKRMAILTSLCKTSANNPCVSVTQYSSATETKLLY